MFQSINAFAVMLCGVFLAWVVKESVAGNCNVRIWGNRLVSALCERRVLHLHLKGLLVRNVWSLFSATDGIRPGGDGLCELFIDPVAMSQITRIEIPGVTGVLTGIYMLLSGGSRTISGGRDCLIRHRRLRLMLPGRSNYSINAYIEVFDQITWAHWRV